MENQTVKCIKCNSQTTTSVATKTSKGYLCPDCAKKAKNNRLIIVLLAILVIVLSIGAYYLFNKQKEVKGFEGIENVQEEINVKIQKPSFSIANTKAANNPNLNGTPIDNIESFKKAFENSKIVAESAYSSTEDMSEASHITIAIPNITSHFEFNSSKLNIESTNLINEFAKAYLQTDKTASILIEGYACNIGSDEANDKISIDRASSAKDILLKAGVKEDKIIVKGYGKRKNSSFKFNSFSEYRRVIISIQ